MKLLENFVVPENMKQQLRESTPTTMAMKKSI